MKNTVITTFKNIRELVTPLHIAVSDVFDLIKCGVYKELAEQIRSEEDKEKRNELKKQLPSALFSGKFMNRKSGAMPDPHSGLIVIDIDGLDSCELLKTKDELCRDKYTLACFISPSGNGLKLIVRISASIENHEPHFLALSEYYSKMGIEVDQSGKNVNRVCYLSYDPDIFINYSSFVFTDKKRALEGKKRSSQKSVALTLNEQQTVNNLLIWWRNNYTYTEGSKHESIVQLACALNRYGINEATAVSVCANIADNDRSARLNENRVMSTYRLYSHQHNTEYFEDKDKKNSALIALMSDNIESFQGLDEQIEEFEGMDVSQMKEAVSSISEEELSNKPKRVFWRYDDGKIKIDTKALLDHINETGYYIYYESDSPDSYVLVREKNRVLRKVDTREIKQFILDFVESEGKNIVYDKLSDNQKYWNINFLNALPVIKPKFLRDTEHKAFFPMKTHAYMVTEKECKKCTYLDLDAYVWESQVLNDYEFVEKKGCDFARFLNLVSGGIEKKTLRLMSVIGFLMHTYKDRSFAKNVFIYDKNLSQLTGEPEGGSGKSLLIEALKNVREVCAISGDRVDFTRSFVFQEIKESTQIIWVDETEKNTDFTKFFSRTTGDMPIERKGANPINIPYEDSGKFVFTTNYKPKGYSGSHQRRRIDFGIEPYFSVNHTPKQEFGRRFFADWDKEDWDRFFSTCIYCLMLYLENGIIPYEDKEDIVLSMASETDPLFAEYIVKSGFIEKLKKEPYIVGREVYNAFTSQYEIEPSKFSVKKFYSYIKKTLYLHSINYKFTGTGNQKMIVCQHDR